MQGLKRSQSDGQLADIFGSLGYGQDNLLPMGQHVGGAGADVQVGEVGFGAWESREHPVGGGSKTGIITTLARGQNVKCIDFQNARGDTSVSVPWIFLHFGFGSLSAPRKCTLTFVSRTHFD